MSDTNKIPFLDLVTPHEQLKDELVTAFQAALSTAGFIGGPVVEAFEREFAAFCDAQYCVGVGSGTDALRFAFIAAGLGSGDIVVTAPNTFIATTEAISQCGALPVFVDVDEQTYNLDPNKLEQYLETECARDAGGALVDKKRNKRVAAVVPIHLYGQTADMDAIGEIAARYGLQVFEDSCQAHGAQYFSKKENRWRKAGSMGLAAAFSFYPGKNLGACGEAGAVTTNDAELAKKIRMLRDHGQAQKYYHDVEGYNGRLDAIQAGILKVKLKKLPEWNQQRQACAAIYRELLAGDPDVKLPTEYEWSKAVYHLFVVRVARRAELQSFCGEANIGTAIHYPIPLHLQKAYAHLGYRAGDFPVAERVAGEIVSLPMFPGLTRQQQERVAKRLKEFFAQAGATVAAGASL
jgi:dTDP-4-amino-4,6-dideoxygalactose transaminase